MVGRHGAAPMAVRKHLCGLRDRCIACNPKNNRNAKAELNHRSQACDVLADTGIRVAENGRA